MGSKALNGKGLGGFLANPALAATKAVKKAVLPGDLRIPGVTPAGAALSDIDRAAEVARDREIERDRRRKGRESTSLAGATLGDINPSNLARKQLLGE